MSRLPVAASGLLFVGAIAVTTNLVTSAQQHPSDVVKYTSAGELMKPADFREWVFLSSGLGMTYNPPEASGAAASRAPSFTNVYVNPSSYRRFVQTGTWPDQTMFVLEIRASASEGSINLGGRYQTELRAVEAEVKDSTHFADKWAYFNFGATADRVAPLPKTASCYACHGTKAAVEQTFVQFYPTLMEVARRMGTVNKGYAATEGAHP
jgi:Cytochrome P460